MNELQSVLSKNPNELFSGPVMLLEILLSHLLKLKIQPLIGIPVNTVYFVLVQIACYGNYETIFFGFRSVWSIENVVSMAIWRSGKVTMLHVICEHAP